MHAPSTPPCGSRADRSSAAREDTVAGGEQGAGRLAVAPQRGFCHSPLHRGIPSKGPSSAPTKLAVALSFYGWRRACVLPWLTRRNRRDAARTEPRGTEAGDGVCIGGPPPRRPRGTPRAHGRDVPRVGPTE